MATGAKKPRRRARKKTASKTFRAGTVFPCESPVAGVGFVANRKDLVVLFVGSQHVLLDRDEANDIAEALCGFGGLGDPF